MCQPHTRSWALRPSWVSHVVSDLFVCKRRNICAVLWDLAVMANSLQGCRSWNIHRIRVVKEKCFENKNMEEQVCVNVRMVFGSQFMRHISPGVMDAMPFWPWGIKRNWWQINCTAISCRSSPGFSDFWWVIDGRLVSAVELKASRHLVNLDVRVAVCPHPLVFRNVCIEEI